MLWAGSCRAILGAGSRREQPLPAGSGFITPANGLDAPPGTLIVAGGTPPGQTCSHVNPNAARQLHETLVTTFPVHHLERAADAAARKLRIFHGGAVIPNEIFSKVADYRSTIKGQPGP